MGKRNRRSTPDSRDRQRPKRLRLLLPSALGLAVLIGVTTWYFMPRPSPVSDAAQFQGSPRLAVDRELIDFGNVSFERMVRASFRLRNVGDQPLQLVVNPRVEVVEGC